MDFENPSKLYRRGLRSRRRQAMIAAKRLLRKARVRGDKFDIYERIIGTDFGLKFDNQSWNIKEEYKATLKARERLMGSCIYVPEVYGFITIEDAVVMVTEHIDGDYPEINWNDAPNELDKIEAICEQHRCWHCDVHDENVLVDRKTKSIVLIDWEMADFN